MTPGVAVTDTHAHWIPAALAALLRRRDEAPRIEAVLGGGGEVFVTYQGRRPFAGTFGNPADQVAAMARWGTARQVLSLSSLFGVECLPAEEAAPLCAAFNDGAAGLVALGAQ